MKNFILNLTRGRLARAAVVTAAFVAVAVPASGATTNSVTIDPDGPGGKPPIVVGSLDWNVGNFLAQGGAAAFAAGEGATFKGYYQARLQGFNDANGDPIAGALNGIEWTATAELTERVTGSGNIGGNPTATFGLAEGTNIFRIYYDDTPDANNLAGTGFNNGTLILEATVNAIDGVFTITKFGSDSGTQLFDQFGADNYGGKESIYGSGAADLQAEVEFWDSSFFQDFVEQLTLTFFNTSEVLPFRQVNPSRQFVDAAGNPIVPVLGQINGESGPDVQLQVDANQSFSVIPVPAAAWMGLTLLGSIACGRRRLIGC